MQQALSGNWGLSIEKVILFASISAPLAELEKNSNSTQIIQEFQSIKPYNSLVRWHFNHGRVQVLSPSLSPCWSSDNHFWRHYQQTIRGFYCRINGWAIGATLPHSLGWSDRQAQTAKLVQSLQSATGSLYWLCSKNSFVFECFVNFEQRLQIFYFLRMEMYKG